MRSRLCAYQLVGFSLSFLGWLCSLVATMLPQWLISNTNLILTETSSIGIWETCVAQDGGAVQCKGYDSLLNLPQDIQLARILMCVSVALGLLGLLLSLSGSTWITCFGDDEATKGKLAVSGGVFFLLAGVTTLVPVSYTAHLTVVKFWDPTVPEFVPRWEFGQALFVGWLGSILLLPGGLLLITSQCCFRQPKANIQLKAPLETVNIDGRQRRSSGGPIDGRQRRLSGAERRSSGGPIDGRQRRSSGVERRSSGGGDYGGGRDGCGGGRGSRVCGGRQHEERGDGHCRGDSCSRGRGSGGGGGGGGSC